MTTPRFPKLSSERLQLEPLAPAHSAGMFELWSEPLVCEHSGPATDSEGAPIELPAATTADSDRLLHFWIGRAEAGTGLRWAALRRDPFEFVGAVGFNVLGPQSEYAYHFVPRVWGEGLATEASQLALGWAFGAGATSVELFAEPENLRSIRLARRLGFVSSSEAPGELIRYVLAADQHAANAASSPRS